MPLGQATASATGQGSAAASTRGRHDQLALSNLIVPQDVRRRRRRRGLLLLEVCFASRQVDFCAQTVAVAFSERTHAAGDLLGSLDLINPDSISPETRSAGEEMIFKWQQHRRSIFIYNQTRDHFHWHHYQLRSGHTPFGAFSGRPAAVYCAPVSTIPQHRGSVGCRTPTVGGIQDPS